MKNLGHLWRIPLMVLLAAALVSAPGPFPLQAQRNASEPAAPTATGGPVEATVNGTFQPSGRDSSDWYFTIEGANNGTYARWGVAEFDTSGLFSDAILAITGFELILTLTQSNA